MGKEIFSGMGNGDGGCPFDDRAPAPAPAKDDDDSDDD